MKTIKFIAASALLASAGTVFPHEGAAPPDAHAHAQHGHAATAAPAEQTPFGIAGDARKVQRTITLRMGDDMRFAPSHITVKRGETVRLRVLNQGQVMHEIVLGTPGSLSEHAQMMQQHPGMDHDAPHMAHVAPGQKGELVWQFNRAGEFDFACLGAGHFEAGMKGTITVKP